ncbi:MAG: TonB-dependent receptor [Burkholderiaceae bacterium]|uniref:TonB-dependent receptor n=1 Tax=Zoogloea sp. TaxID=49181 RepID=UPI0017F71283|nr:TonB-dependent receptor [Zoogloea sp.]MCK6396578.1 TonB-dependent receptor [Zoogloea sp.]NUP87569.1 TonB-dependent receptor [Burkholderiaceae bacterium]
MRKHWASTQGLRHTALAVAAGLCLASVAVHAQESAGSISGRGGKGDVVVVENKSIGVTRQLTLDASGSFQVSQLPAGTYTVTVNRANGTKESVLVTVQAGQGAVALFGATQRVEVTGSLAPRNFDVKSTESTQILSKAEIDRIPVQRDVTAITLLAPGAVVGDSRLGQTNSRAGNVPSLGGASPAENAYYINGFNVTNIVNGVAFNQVPYEGVAEQQVKTGGYGAEFGRSLGGVISVTTKRGTNEWRGGVNLKHNNSSLQGSAVRTFRDPVTGEWSLVDKPGGTDSTYVNLWAGGPIVQDKLYVFGLVQGAQTKSNYYYAATQEEIKNDTPQYLVKVDWNVNDRNLFELTAFNDKSKDKTDTWDSSVEYGTERGEYKGPSTETAGGENVILKWTSWLNDDLSVSALAGVGKYDRSSAPAGADCPVVVDLRTSTRKDYGCWTATRVTDPNANDQREAFRLDAEWVLGKHTLRGGLDHEIYSVQDGTATPGEGQYILRTRNPGQKLSNGYVIPGTPGVDPSVQIVEFRLFQNGGKFKTINSAWYLEDTIQVTNNLIASVGLRNESFTNKNAAGTPFIEVENTWAPRFGMSWDVTGNADLKVYGNLGRYYIPVYANTNVRLSGTELDYRDFYMYGGNLGTDRFSRPALGAQLGERVYSSNGETPNPLSVVDPNIKPMYQDEFIAGFQKSLGQRWSFGAKYTHRKLGSGMDDICNDEGPYEWALANGYSEDQAAAIGGAIGHCFLYNPGSDLTANIDLDGTGVLSPVVIPASALHMPKAKRTYDALEITFERAWDKKWSFQGSYVLAFSKGNAEGYVKSDIGQDDAGISQDFDYPGLMEGAEGYLPNDRRHTFKFWGSYAFSDELRLGANLIIQSGRPKNCFGVYAGELDGVSQLYGDASFWCGGKLNPRGTLGRTPWTEQLNLQATYTPAWLKGMTFSMDVINVFNKRGVRTIQEAEGSGMDDPKSTYGQPLSLQPARSIRLLAQYEF